MSAQRVTLTPNEEAALVWRMPPENQGQIIAIDYAADEDYVYERSHDRSSRRTSFRRRPWRASDETYIGLNRVPAGFDARAPRSKRAKTVRTRANGRDASAHDAMYALMMREGEWLHGGDPAGTAQQWIRGGFDAATAKAWVAARCFDARAAQELRDAGVTPQQASTVVSDGLGGYSDTLAYKVANGDLAVEKALKILGIRRRPARSRGRIRESGSMKKRFA